MVSPKKVLIVSLRRIGDVLLSTPLASSLRAQWPDAKIDWLVFDSSADILSTNSAADQILVLPEKSTFLQNIFFILKRLKHYDIAFSTQAGDRPTFFAWFLAKKVCGFKTKSRGGNYRKKFLSYAVPTNSFIHRVDEVLSLLAPLGIQPKRRLIHPLPQCTPLLDSIPHPYVIFHPFAAFRYKYWNSDGWKKLCEFFHSKGYSVVVTGSKNPQEKKYLDIIFEGKNVYRFDGMLTWSELTYVIQRCALFIGVDTSVTHLAAATDARVLTIFGPTDDRRWIPISTSNRVSMIRSKKSCVPCGFEGCERHIHSYSECLDGLSSSEVEEIIKDSCLKN